MPCSAVTLSLATIAAVVSVALLAIAFSTDNWIRIDVKRDRLKEKLNDSPSDFDKNEIYFTRTKGLFRICFPQQRPDVPLYLSPVETYCMNVDYFITDQENLTDDFSQDEMAKLHMGRAMIALFIMAFFFVFIAFWTGVAGCWRRSSGNITSTAILMLLTCLFSAGGMGLWHGVEYYENEKLSGSNTQAYYKDWPQAVRDSSYYNLDWSFYLSWISVFFSLISTALFAAAASCLTKETQPQNGFVMTTVYPQKQQGYYGYAYPTAYPAYPPGASYNY